jgi:flavin-dependent dehydrogenase
MPDIQVVGAGPAGTAAAIAGLERGAAVRVVERSRRPRHKVCGEFVPFEACRELERLGVWQDVVEAAPPRLRRVALHFGSYCKQWNLDEPGILSRLLLDRLLLSRAEALGARVSRGEAWTSSPAPHGVRVHAAGRAGTGSRPRLFGFKAHFAGPGDDSVGLYFTSWGYCGVSSVEGGSTNICGLAPEDVLRRCHFEIDDLLAAEPALAARVRPLERRMAWLKTGPLCFARGAGATGAEGVYPAGEALGFLDPFTGSGILHALLTGRLAGDAAACRLPRSDYARQCAALLDRPFAVSGAFRLLLRAGLSRLALLVPGPWLYRLTRAEVARA